jgi:hypothetical protein
MKWISNDKCCEVHYQGRITEKYWKSRIISLFLSAVNLKCIQKSMIFIGEPVSSTLK